MQGLNYAFGVIIGILGACTIGVAVILAAMNARDLYTWKDNRRAGACFILLAVGTLMLYGSLWKG